jgi:hypothetical protein
MAPSRALLRRIASASAQQCMRPAPRLLTTVSTRPQQISRCSALQPRHTAFPAKSCMRSYSVQANAAPTPPDYLNEAELHIFNKIKGELEPVKLEVRMQHRLCPIPCGRGDGSSRISYTDPDTRENHNARCTVSCKSYVQCGVGEAQDGHMVSEARQHSCGLR